MVLFKQVAKPIIKTITEPITKAKPNLRFFLFIAVIINPEIINTGLAYKI